MDDRDLIRAAQRGDEQAWAEVYARYHKRVERLLRSLSGNTSDDDVYDLCQQVWMSAVIYLPRYEVRYDDDAVLMPWLAKVARHLYANFTQRAWARQVVHNYPLDRLDNTFEQTALGRVFAMQLIERLPDPLDRNILELRVWHDRTFGDIAAYVGLREVAVRNRYYAALNTLRDTLGELAPPARKRTIAIGLSPERQAEARRRYVAGEMSVVDLASAYGVAVGTMKDYVRGSKRIACMRCATPGVPPARTNSPICGACHEALDAAEQFWCRSGKHDVDAAFRRYAHMCKPCANAYDNARYAEKRARWSAAP